MRLPNGTIQVELDVPAGSVGEVHVPLLRCERGQTTTIMEMGVEVYANGAFVSHVSLSLSRSLSFSVFFLTF